MSANATSPNNPTPATRWRVWVDGCGGLLLLCGDRFSVGGMHGETSVDVRVQADWPRVAGAIERQGSDYFWVGAADAGPPKSPLLIANGQRLPIAGSATMTLTQPSPLCESAVLNLQPPHRFDQHVDGVILVHETLMIGSERDNHIRCRECEQRVVLVRREDQWLGKSGLSGDFQPLPLSQRVSLAGLAMTLEKA